MTRPPRSDRPLYTRIAASLKSRILAGALAPGARLPGEDGLARSMGVSRSTIRQAIAALREDGYLTSRRGSGNYVAEELPMDPLTPRSGPLYTGFLEDLEDEGVQVEERHRSQRTVEANRAVATDLRVPTGTRVVRYEGVRVRSGTAYGVATDHLPLAIADKITPDVLATSPTIVDALSNVGHQVAESLQRLEPTLLDSAMAEGCGMASGSPALAVTGVAYDDERTPIDSYTLTIVHGYGIGLHLTRAADPSNV